MRRKLFFLLGIGRDKRVGVRIGGGGGEEGGWASLWRWKAREGWREELK